MIRDRFDPARRSLLRRASALAVAGAAGTHAHLLSAAHGPVRTAAGFGPLKPMRDLNTGLKLLALPAGFSYTSFGWSGDTFEDGTLIPSAQDGMGVVAEEGGLVTLIRNHEMVTDSGAFGPDRIHYDPVAGGGTATLQFDSATATLKRAWPSLSGTLQNCAGGITPWGTWLSCEEFVYERARGGASMGRLTREHGYVFEVHPDGRKPEPLVGMGQFRHEAAVVHAPSGHVYLTEDREPRAGFYRYVPRRPGELIAGGALSMLAVEGRKDMRDGLTLGESYKTRWVPIAQPDWGNSPGTNDGLGVLEQGVAEGGALFTRLEGIYATKDTVYFTATNGGDAACGQVFAYHPGEERLTLVFESPGRDTLDYPDNICFSPRGGLVLCEDGDRQAQQMFGLSAAGELFPFARNEVRLDGEPFGHAGDFSHAEWAGSCFSRDGKWLFANVYRPGFSVAITGPWKKGLI